MSYSRRMLIAAVSSLLLHAVAGRGLEQLPEQREERPPHTVAVRIMRTPPPPPPPPPAPEPPPEVEKPRPEELHEAPAPEPRPRPHRRKRRKPRRVRPRREPPPGHTTPEPDRPTTQTPVFGLSEASFSGRSAGPSMPAGNTSMASPAEAPPTTKKGPVKPLAPPVPMHRVTVMPRIVGRCRGHYTERAREAGVEGVVELELIVGSDGRTRDIKVLRGLGYGLDEAAVQTLRRCRFEPGRRGGEAVAVRLRSFRIRFFLEDGL